MLLTFWWPPAFYSVWFINQWLIVELLEMLGKFRRDGSYTNLWRTSWKKIEVAAVGVIFLRGWNTIGKILLWQLWLGTKRSATLPNRTRNLTQVCCVTACKAWKVVIIWTGFSWIWFSFPIWYHFCIFISMISRCFSESGKSFYRVLFGEVSRLAVSGCMTAKVG